MKSFLRLCLCLMGITLVPLALANPRAVAVDRAGNLYVSDVDSGTINKITPAGVVTLLGGGQSAIKDPIGLAVDRAGAVIVADADGNAVFKIALDGAVTSLGKPAAGESGFNTPTSVAVDASGNIFVTDNGGNAIRKIAPDGTLTTFAGKNGASGSADGAGVAARFAAPRGLAADAAGNVYVADTDNHTIRKITTAGVVTTLAGKPGETGNVNGTGAAARFSEPRSVAVDSAGNVFVADTGNSAIRQITTDGMVTTIVAATKP
jgi:DNA-binding beta-propeller fold protein YncE